ncbi:hypothetical protein LJC48_05365 [Desulfovibrio sp. OttesenSCG-928-C06]|nr:hypothetical protein [Desulfovibrio sp. OttesenSCG-928-C06]
MSITLYTAPDCIRCRIVKAYFADRGIEYATVDFKEDKDEFNKFYRANRPVIYRNPEGVEFPLFSDGEAVRQGSGIILAYMLAGDKLEQAVMRSHLLHGWISGLYPSVCPKEQEENFLEVVKWLEKGGLKVYIQTDGRNPAFLERVLKTGQVSKVVFNILGPAQAYADSFGGAVSAEELAKTAELVTAFPSHEVRLLISPTKRADGSYSWTSKEEAAEAAKMLAEATGNKTMPFFIAAVDKENPLGQQGLGDFPQDQLLPYRSAVRKFMFKADLAKPEQ